MCNCRAISFHAPIRRLLLIACFSLSAFSGAYAQDLADTTDPAAEEEPSVVDLESEAAGKIDWGEELMKGEEISFVLIFVAVAGLAFFLERLYSVRKGRFVSSGKAEALLKNWQRGDWEKVRTQARRDNSIFGRAAHYVASHTHLSFEIVSFTASDIISRGVGRQLQKTYPLAIVATVSPLLGLLGTIIGMIEAFQKVAIMGDTGDASVLADSIGKALITTAIGLIIAIPALSAYHYFKMKINNLGIRIEEEIDEMLALWLTPDEPVEDDRHSDYVEEEPVEDEGPPAPRQE